MSGILLLLGTNLGDRKTNLEQALSRLSKREIRIKKSSTVYESEPWGISDQPWFWNMVIEVETSLPPFDLLRNCLEIEKEMGRVRKQKWGERLIDIDILYCGNDIISKNELKVPHPGIPERKFTLMPLVEKWPTMLHPVLKKNQSEMLKDLNSTLECRKTDVVLVHDFD